VCTLIFHSQHQVLVNGPFGNNVQFVISQLDLYKRFLASPEIRAVLSASKSPVASISLLKRLCDHPELLSRRNEIAQLGQLAEADIDKDETENDRNVTNLTIPELISESRKLEILLKLLESFQGVRKWVSSLLLSVNSSKFYCWKHRGHAKLTTHFQSSKQNMNIWFIPFAER
jgi:SNF2 family DNA or RNA helicase